MEIHDGLDTLHYVDPPYLPETRDAGADYVHEMTVQQHIELATFLHTVKGLVVLSGYDSPLYAELYQDWEVVKRNALADGARKRVEVLWLKAGTQQRQMNL